jgi:hypothetical protein
VLKGEVVALTILERDHALFRGQNTSANQLIALLRGLNQFRLQYAGHEQHFPHDFGILGTDADGLFDLFGGDDA